MSNTNRSIEYQLNEAAKWNQKAAEYLATAKSCEGEVKKYEILLEGLQLNLREELNSEPSSVPVEPPKEVVIDQIGREG